MLFPIQMQLILSRLINKFVPQDLIFILKVQLISALWGNARYSGSVLDCWSKDCVIDPVPGAGFITNSSNYPILSPVQYSLSRADLWPKTPFISSHISALKINKTDLYSVS